MACFLSQACCCEPCGYPVRHAKHNKMVWEEPPQYYRRAPAILQETPVIIIITGGGGGGEKRRRGFLEAGVACDLLIGQIGCWLEAKYRV